ncbi:hypothetical protein E8E11_008710 [Didymella keratinophila]|nr:hypothetical protein E8E11_008710 [Didymella keratinophila]
MYMNMHDAIYPILEFTKDQQQPMTQQDEAWILPKPGSTSADIRPSTSAAFTAAFTTTSAAAMSATLSAASPVSFNTVVFFLRPKIVHLYGLLFLAPVFNGFNKLLNVEHV